MLLDRRGPLQIKVGDAEFIHACVTLAMPLDENEPQLCGVQMNKTAQDKLQPF